MKNSIEDAAFVLRAAVDKLEAFRVANAEVVAQLGLLEQEVARASLLVRELAVDALPPGGATTQAGFAIARVVRKSYDVKNLLEGVPHLRAIDGLVKESIDPKIMKAAIQAGVVSKDEVEKYRTVVVSDYGAVS